MRLLLVGPLAIAPVVLAIVLTALLQWLSLRRGRLPVLWLRQQEARLLRTLRVAVSVLGIWTVAVVLLRFSRGVA